MKIVQVIDTLNIGGAEKVFVDICNLLIEKNQNVDALFLLNAGLLKSELNKKIVKYQLFRDYKWSYKKMRECSLMLRKYDIVHCHFRHVYRYISIVKFFFPFEGKVVLHDHFGSIDLDKRVPFLFLSFLKPKFYIGVSSTLTDWAKSKLKMSERFVFNLDNIISKNTEKLSLGRSFEFVLVSNIKPVKNNLFAVNLMNKMKRSLLIVGQNQDQVYFDELVSNVSGDILIKTDIKNAQSILHTSSFGLHTSLSESGPLVLIEYLAHGIPFLSYDTGAVAQKIKNYFPDFFINNFDLDNWEHRILKIQNMKICKREIEKVYEKEFGKDIYYSKLIKIYSCISQKD